MISKKVFTVRIAIALVILLLSLQSFSQITKEKKGFWSGWSINLNAGASLAYTDIDNYRIWRVTHNNNEWRLGYGLILQKRVHPLWQIRGQIMYGELSGTKRKHHYWFEASNLETSISATIDLVGLFWGQKVRLITFYGMGGVGFAQWRTELKTYPTGEPIGGNGNLGSGFGGRTMEAVVPFGLGLDFNLGYHWNINVEASLRFVNSDVLDGKEGGFKYDFYSYDFVGVTYKFKRKKRPEPEIPPPPVITREEVEVPEKPVVEDIQPETKVIVDEDQQNLLRMLQERMLEEDSKTGMYESPWQGVEFMVQIAASRTAVDPSYFQEKYNISGDITRTHSEGWYYYSIGKYVKYWRALEYKNILLTRNNTKGAFVVAYRDGKRLLLSDLIHHNVDERTGEEFVEKQRPVSKKSYSVQVMASRDGNISGIAIKEMYGIDEDVYKEFANGWFRYIVGNFMNYSQASKLRNKLRLQGLREAFIVGYRDGQRVPIESLKE